MSLIKRDCNLLSIKVHSQDSLHSHSHAVVTYVLFPSALYSATLCFIQIERPTEKELQPGLWSSLCAMPPKAKCMFVPTLDYAKRCKSRSAIKGRMNPKQKINQWPSINLPTSALVLDKKSDGQKSFSGKSQHLSMHSSI